MTFDTKRQGLRALQHAEHYETQVHKKRLPSFTANQADFINDLVKYIYAVAYQEGWENARTQP